MNTHGDLLSEASIAIRTCYKLSDMSYSIKVSLDCVKTNFKQKLDVYNSQTFSVDAMFAKRTLQTQKGFGTSYILSWGVQWYIGFADLNNVLFHIKEIGKCAIFLKHVNCIINSLCFNAFSIKNCKHGGFSVRKSQI